MTSFSAKNWKKQYCVVRKIMVSKVPYYVLYWYLTSDQKEICFYFQNLDNNAKLKEENEKKKKIYL